MPSAAARFRPPVAGRSRIRAGRDPRPARRVPPADPARPPARLEHPVGLNTAPATLGCLRQTKLSAPIPLSAPDNTTATVGERSTLTSNRLPVPPESACQTRHGPGPAPPAV